MSLMRRTKDLISSGYPIQTVFSCIPPSTGVLSPVNAELQLPPATAPGNTRLPVAASSSPRSHISLQVISSLPTAAPLRRSSHALCLCHTLSPAPTQSCPDARHSHFQMTAIASGCVIFHRVCHSWHRFLRWHLRLRAPHCSASSHHIRRQSTRLTLPSLTGLSSARGFPGESLRLP